MGVGCSAGINERSADERSALKSKKKLKNFRSFGKRKKGEVSDQYLKSTVAYDSGEIRFSFCGDFFPSTPRKSGDAKRSSFTGRAAISGIERAIEALDAFGSGVANLNSTGFISGLTVRGNKISILAFEVANTITKGANLIQSLTKENVLHVKQSIFFSEGVQRLVSTDSNVLLSIAAADKREELDIFCREIVRFGNLCKDPQWHNLNRFFEKMRSENTVGGSLKEEADLNMHELIVLGHHTAELYHELNALDRFEQDYRQKREEAESLNVPYGESLKLLKSELKHQKTFVMSLKRKSLWTKRMEEIVEKLVDFVVFIHQQILEVFGNIYDEEVGHEPVPRRLGVAGLALHYSNLTNQIHNIASRPSFLPTNTRDSLYSGLPASVKNALRSSLRKSDSAVEHSMPQIKAEMDKILQWLVPMASGTSRMYRGFGWVGEWANTSNDFRKQTGSNGNPNRLQTLYHVDKEKMDSYILDLVKWLHHLINATKQRDQGLIRSLPERTSVLKGPPVHSAMKRFSFGGGKPIVVELSEEERSLLQKVSQIQPLLNISKSQDFSSIRRRSFKLRASCRSTGSSPSKEYSRKEAEFDDDDSDLEVLNRLDLAY
ncbi:hypothetical protein V2J09_019840 [Rumex salicifolius]